MVSYCPSYELITHVARMKLHEVVLLFACGALVGAAFHDAVVKAP
jgi:hypothetical protein